MYRIRNFARAALLILPLVATAAAMPADLHLALKQSIPAKDATVATAPQRIELHFTQAPQAAATSIRVHGDAGNDATVGRTTARDGDATIVTASFERPLAPGKYHVMWRAMAQDGHVITGEYGFTYTPAAD